LKLFQHFMSVVTHEIKSWNTFRIVHKKFYFTCYHLRSVYLVVVWYSTVKPDPQRATRRVDKRQHKTSTDHRLFHCNIFPVIRTKTEKYCSAVYFYLANYQSFYFSLYLHLSHLSYIRLICIILSASLLWFSPFLHCTIQQTACKMFNKRLTYLLTYLTSLLVASVGVKRALIRFHDCELKLDSHFVCICCSTRYCRPFVFSLKSSPPYCRLSSTTR